MDITREQLAAYLDDALSDAETAQVEKALRDSDRLRGSLQQVMQERDRGDHSLGAIWRRERLTCPSREKLGNYLLQVLEPEEQDYIRFHLEDVQCVYCQANLNDLEAQLQEPATQARQRTQRFFQTSADFLHVCRDTHT